MNQKIIFFPIFLTFLSQVSSLWEFAITTKNRIAFFDENWYEVSSAAHQFDELSAISFDETEEKIYFNDQQHQNGSIFLLKFPLDERQNNKKLEVIDKIVTKTQNETVTGIVYDPLYQNLYWTDAKNRKIFVMSMIENEENNDSADSASEPKIFLDFINEETYPDGIAIDFCKRKLYWTNSNHRSATIESVDLDQKIMNRKIVIGTNLYLPHGIVVDQFSHRIFWVVDLQGSHYAVESAALDGSDRQTIVRGLNNVPFNLVVTKSSIYWTDLTHNTIWNVSKTNSSTTEKKPSKVKTFSFPPKGIVTRLNYLTKLESDTQCSEIVKKIKSRLLSAKLENKPSYVLKTKDPKMLCLNDGKYNPISGLCICKAGFKGQWCEIAECYNRCIHGTCEISSLGFPECVCQDGFYGERCETYKCSDYCLNDGKCEIVDDIPKCHCQDRFAGPRCESNSTEICALLCQMLKYEPNINLPFGCYDVCDEIQEGTEHVSTLRQIQLDEKQSCDHYKIIMIVFAVLSVLLLSSTLCLTIFMIKRRKPARPRIKKTFLVQKKISQPTELCSRPVATEQCQITIENCCNMNICDTPCFDPNILQQTFDSNSCSNTKENKQTIIDSFNESLYKKNNNSCVPKEEKKALIDNMEENLY